MTSNQTTSQASSQESASINRRPLIVAGIVLGMGQAGFFDGIVIHQLLQWHHMFSSVKTDATVAGLELNTLGDGLFHLFDWLLTLIGIFLLWRAAKQSIFLSAPTFIGSLLLGFGGFNLIEGVIDHQLLGIHHVRPGSHTLVYDVGFLVISALIAGAGWIVLQSAKPNGNEAKT
ncbi:DUF2243 domain-containing protein [Coleofasciculus sp. FACHB-1120]|uniref:DUF2243 domain-containing protein n=1 Tax=Coleofasciculus sp. FACHB-1120 TaxID=2692783 RepID=UPI001688D766|nr:DUF2243 domain-containing protein [Coleofasciculus sp. FACHB-1120]MBD2743604.1 DUF2243 domain-containing protein [Coleofasciculus sp. FACHB-1120]